MGIGGLAEGHVSSLALSRCHRIGLVAGHDARQRSNDNVFGQNRFDMRPHRSPGSKILGRFFKADRDLNFFEVALRRLCVEAIIAGDCKLIFLDDGPLDGLRWVCRQVYARFISTLSRAASL